MNRRDFLKFFGLTVAGIYVPKKSYFFMPRYSGMDMGVGDCTAISVLYVDGSPVRISPILSYPYTKELLEYSRTKIMAEFAVPPHLLGEVSRGTHLDTKLRELMIERAIGNERTRGYNSCQFEDS